MEGQQKQQVLEIYLREYDKLKDEQNLRIGIRDNLIYATLVAIAGVPAVLITTNAKWELLVVLPPVCIILGWMYLINDIKISLISQYIEISISERIRSIIQENDLVILGWEAEHRNVKGRLRRKLFQLFVDEFTFVGLGFTPIIIVMLTIANLNALLLWSMAIEATLLAILGLEIFINSGIRKNLH